MVEELGFAKGVFYGGVLSLGFWVILYTGIETLAR